MSTPTLPSLPPLTGDTSWIDHPTGMENIPMPIAPARPSASTGSTSTNNATGSRTLGSYLTGTRLFQDVAGSLENIVFIILGLMLIGAAVWALASQTDLAQQAKRQFVQGVKEGAMA